MPLVPLSFLEAVQSRAKCFAVPKRNCGQQKFARSASLHSPGGGVEVPSLVTEAAT